MTHPNPYGTAISERFQRIARPTLPRVGGISPQARAHLSNLFSGEKA